MTSAIGKNASPKYVFVYDGTSEHHRRLMAFLNNYFCNADLLHVFCGISCNSDKVRSVENAECVGSFVHVSKKITEALAECDRIVLVGLFDPALCLYLCAHNKLLKKTAVALHGGEFYGLRGKPSLSRRLLHVVRKKVISQIDMCGTFTPGDYDMAKRYFVLPTKHCLVELPWHFEVSEEDAEMPKPSNPLTIMVGHNAFEQDHTLETLQMLARYRDENIRIVAPLSYGEERYRTKVVETGKRLFGDKFAPVLSWIEPKEYQRMLKSASVYVMGVDRQAGTFNVNLMLRLGCKVFLRTDTTLGSLFSGHCGCLIHDISEVGALSFGEFVYFSEEERMANHRAMKESLSPETCIASWKAMLAG